MSKPFQCIDKYVKYIHIYNVYIRTYNEGKKKPFRQLCAMPGGRVAAACFPLLAAILYART